MTKFNRRAFMSVAGIAAAETAFSPLVSARTNRSDAPATLTELDNPEFNFRETEGVRKWASHSGAQWRTIVRGRDRGKRKEAELYASDPVTGKAIFGPVIFNLPGTRTAWALFAIGARIQA
jgi:hypothetical protein